MNFSWKREDIVFDYLFTSDSRVSRKTGFNIAQGFDKIRDKIFIGKHIEGSDISWLNYPENFFLESDKVCRYCPNEFGPTYESQIIYSDICFHGLADFYSVVFAAIHFSLFTYPKKIHLVGCDTSPTNHFYSDKTGNSDMPVQKLKVGYARMKMFARLYYHETEIVSINPVGLKGLFKDVYTDEYKKSLSENS